MSPARSLELRFALKAFFVVAGRVSSVTVSVMDKPPRLTVIFSLSPGLWLLTAAVSLFALLRAVDRGDHVTRLEPCCCRRTACATPSDLGAGYLPPSRRP